MAWIAIAAIIIPIIMGFIGWVFNTIITKKIDSLESDHNDTKKEMEVLKEGMTNRAKEGFTTVFKRLDEVKEYGDKNFVRIGEYNIAREYQEKQTEQKIASMFITLNAQIQGLENKIDNAVKVNSDKIEDIKTMIKELKDDKKNGG